MPSFFRIRKRSKRATLGAAVLLAVGVTAFGISSSADASIDVVRNTFTHETTKQTFWVTNHPDLVVVPRPRDPAEVPGVVHGETFWRLVQQQADRSGVEAALGVA